MSRGDGLARLRLALEEHGSLVRGNEAQCPAHDDRAASLSIGQGKDGAVLNCHAGCQYDGVLDALGMSAADLFDERRHRRDGPRPEAVATYTYTDERGEPLFCCVRFVPKDFRQYHVADGRKVWNLNGTRRVLYRLPRIMAAAACGDVVYVVEGEKDVHSVEAAGGVATCNPMGAGPGKWRREYSETLRGAQVVIIADKDEPGRAHAATVAASLAGAAASVRIVEAAEGKDATDHLAAGHSLADLREAAHSVSQSGAALLAAIAEFLRAYVAFPSSYAAVAVALWAAHTHLAAAFESTPRLALLSPEKQCGKTRVLELLELLCAGAEMLSDASPAYLYRRIGSEDTGPVTILLDEADAIWKRGKSDESAEALRSIVNAGHRKSATVGRVEMNGQSAKLTRFPVYAPAALAGIGNLPDTITDRSVIIHMRRRSPDQPVRPYRERITRPEGEQFGKQLQAWCAEVAGKVGDPWPELPSGVTDRKSDVWEPLVMIADLAGGDWPRLAREACTALVTGAADDTETTGTRLLTDLRAEFGDADVLSTEMILTGLCALPESPWADWYGKPLNPRGLAKLLKPYGIKATQVRIGDTTPRGYRRADLIESWRSYLGSGSETATTSATPLASHVVDVAGVSQPTRNCTECGEPLDPVLIKAGFTDHGETEADK